MNKWLLAAAVLTVALLLPLAVAVVADAVDGLAAVEVAGSVVAAILVLLAEGLRRQAFVDLALVLAPLSVVGGIAFARMMERHL